MILAILQARVSSSRLPQKVLKLILQKPMLNRQIERISQSKKINKLILATSEHPSDEPLIALAQEMKIDCYRGSLDDVLTRYYYAALPYTPSHVVRLTGDCPVIDPQLIDELIEFYMCGQFDYARLDDSFPDGLDVEILSYSTLISAYHNAILQSEREHVTLYINSHPDGYRIGVLKNKENQGALRWTVDEQKDFELITKIYESLYHQNPHFSRQDVLAFVRANPSLQTYNTIYKRNEGLLKSLANDRTINRVAT